MLRSGGWTGPRWVHPGVPDRVSIYACPPGRTLADPNQAPNAMRFWSKEAGDVDSMVVAGVLEAGPMLVHLFHDSANEADSSVDAGAVRDVLQENGASILPEDLETEPPPENAPALTLRELEVLRLVSQGWGTLESLMNWASAITRCGTTSVTAAGSSPPPPSWTRCSPLYAAESCRSNNFRPKL